MIKKEVILELLKENSVGFTSAELRTRLHTRSLRLAEYEVLKELRTLHSEGTVRLERGRWVTTVHKIANSSPSTKKNSSISNTTTPSTQLSSSEITHAWSPSKSRILNNITIPAENKIDIQKPAEFSGPWGTFRKLLGYYADCVKNDEGCEASCYLDDCGKRFIFLDKAGYWYPQVGQIWRSHIHLSKNLQSFARNLSLLGESGVLLLGYPLQLWSKTDSEGIENVFMKPIFTYQLTMTHINNGFQIICDDPYPEVNLDWLSYAIKQPEDQRAFLAACGLMDRGQTDESFGDGSRFIDAPDLKTLASGVTKFFSEKLREPLLPESVSSYFPQKPASGIYNKAVLMIGNRTRYTKTLLKELAQIASCSDEQLDQTALRYIFKNREQGADSFQETGILQESIHECSVLETDQLNGEQRQCVASLLFENLTVVTGPPGTGKSQVVAVSMANARLRAQNVIFSSRNHKAIDAVVDRLILDNGQSLVTRANSKKDPSLNFGFEEAIKQLLSMDYDEGAKERWQRVQSRVMCLLQKRGEYGIQADKIQQLRDRLGSIGHGMENISEGWSLLMIEELNKVFDTFPAKSIEKLEHSIGYLRVKKKVSLLDRFRGRFKSIFLRGVTNRVHNFMKNSCPNWPEIPRHKDYDGLCELSEILSQFIAASRYCALRKEAKPIEEELKNLPVLDALTENIKSISEELEKIVQDILRLDVARRKGLPRDADRESLASLKSALRGLDQPVSDEEDRKAVQSALANYTPFILRHFPLWAVTNLSVGSKFPLLRGLFDLAIIDEASQCDIPSAIPILFRAKRVGVVGDPQQLSHVTKIKGSRDALLRKRHGLTQVNNEQRFSYPDTSLYDLFAQTNEVNPIMLKETYRSTIEIAEYSNQNFYGGSLRVLTSAERLKIPRNTKPGIHWTAVVSEIKSAGPHGCIAPGEVACVVNVLKSLLLENQFEGTVGVVTPFVQQKIRLYDALCQEISLEHRMRAQLLVDTAHAFQGDERDVMIMSLCVGPDMPPGSKGFIRQTANLMNVAVSRARAVLHVVGNKSWVSQSGIPHLEKLALPYRDTIPKGSGIQSRWHPHESPWEKVLYNALKEKGLQPEPQYHIMGRRLDMALIHDEKKKIDIEVDGDSYHRNPDGTRKRDDVWRDIQLQGAEWKVMRFWVYQIRENLGDCVNKILKAWSE